MSIKVGQIVWYKPDIFSSWKIGKVVSIENDEFFNIKRLLSFKEKENSETSDTINKVHKKFVEKMGIF